MKERSYTVAEIGQMRSAVEFRWLYGCKLSERPENQVLSSGSYSEGEKVKAVEEQLRTYMLAGVDPEELE